MGFLLYLMLAVIVLFIVYLVAIMPRMRGKPDKSVLDGVYYAHRGLHDNSTDAPENSMRAFKKAVDEGYGIELDIQLSKDNVPVVFHDFTLQRICGVNGRVSDYTFEELQEFSLCGTDQKIPRFTDFLNLVNGQVPLIVEFKIENRDLSLCPIADEILCSYPGTYCMESFNPFGVRWYRKHRPDVIRGQLSEAFMWGDEYRGILYFALHNLLFNFLTKPDFIAYNCKHKKALSRNLCKRLYHNTAVAWTVKSQSELEAIRKDFDLFIFDSFVPKRENK